MTPRPHDVHTGATEEAQAASPAKQKEPNGSRPTSTGNSVEQHDGVDSGAGGAPPPAGPALSPAELQASLARERALEAAVGKTLQRLDAALDHLAQQPREAWQAASYAVANAASDPAFFEFSARIPREKVHAQVAEHLRLANPNLSEKDVEHLTTLVMKHLDANVAMAAAKRMQKLVAGKLEDAAGHFRSAAKDPAQLQQLSARLTHLERRGASEAELAAARTMRAGLGLEADTPATPAALKDAMLARATLMSGEAEMMRGAGEFTLYRRLLTHDVRDVFMKEAGLRHGSWAVAGVAATHARGVADEDAIKHAKLMTSLAFTAVTAGTGAGVLAGMGAAALSNVPSVALAWRAIDSAAAGASAGTAAADAEATARHNARLATIEAGAATAGAGLAGLGVHHLSLTTKGAEIVAEVGGEYVMHRLLEAAAHLFEAHKEQATGEDAVARSRTR
ncbi:MAG: hypothetical protein AB1730_16300 [Myxococcota bacterium]